MVNGIKSPMYQAYRYAQCLAKNIPVDMISDQYISGHEVIGFNSITYFNDGSLLLTSPSMFSSVKNMQSFVDEAEDISKNFYDAYAYIVDQLPDETPVEVVEQLKRHIKPAVFQA